jgi:DNA repair exonuclease SbcCD ATPase subunit
MSTKESYRQKIEAELKQVQTQLAEFEAPEKSLPTNVRIKDAKQVNSLKQKIDSTKTRLKERSEANKDFWDLLRYCF